MVGVINVVFECIPLFNLVSYDVCGFVYGSCYRSTVFRVWDVHFADEFPTIRHSAVKPADTRTHDESFVGDVDGSLADLRQRRSLALDETLSSHDGRRPAPCRAGPAAPRDAAAAAANVASTRRLHAPP